ncbi:MULTISPECIES: CTP synthase [unclassified Microbulbifer]|uniref:CTP synthase C-terminal region-related (seleno)protein n=1 Tax=unclassified Microbulbifer TaxID=2619833 RepID=UPI0027E50733|nr:MULTISPECIES: CTP synthase [unclassified Microbulbifer]
MTVVTIGLVGDFDPSVPAHQAIPPSIELAASALGTGVEYEWVPTPEIRSAGRLAGYSGIWCVPATPYQDMDGALLAIRWARESQVAFLGTCGGFQHAILEYARNVLGWEDADHAESNPEAKRAVVSPLACALVETTGMVRLDPDTLIYRAYGVSEISEGYRCRYGLNPEFRQALLGGPMRGCAFDMTDEIRAVELNRHPFFVATLFQPERRALQGQLSPLVRAFVHACVK